MVTKIAVANLEATPPEKGLFNLWQRDGTWIIRCVRDYKQLLKWRNRKLFQTGPLVNLDYTLRNLEIAHTCYAIPSLRMRNAISR